MMGLSLLAMLAGSALSVSSQEPAPGATTSPALPRTAACRPIAKIWKSDLDA